MASITASSRLGLMMAVINFIGGLFELEPRAAAGVRASAGAS
jgi:hypothetical protein